MNPLLHGPLSKSNEPVSSGLEWISIRLYEHCSLLESPAGTELMYQSLTACKRLMSLLVKHKAECFCCRAVRSAHSLPNNLSVTSFTCFNPVGVIGHKADTMLCSRLQISSWHHKPIRFTQVVDHMSSGIVYDTNYRPGSCGHLFYTVYGTTSVIMVASPAVVDFIQHHVCFRVFVVDLCDGSNVNRRHFAANHFHLNKTQIHHRDAKSYQSLCVCLQVK